MPSEKRFFVGIDSDGTVFDSMTAKHKLAFVPAAIEIWQLKPIEKEFTDIELSVNLFTDTRGIDRFSGLYLVFKKLDALLRKKGIAFSLPAYESLHTFLQESPVWSNDALSQYNQEKKDLFLEQTLAWSKKCNLLFQEEAEKIPPFSLVEKALQQLSEMADIVIVSSASTQGLQKDFKKHGLDQYVKKIAGQEMGSKTQQLKDALTGYNPSRCLMIGDAIGDYEAAKDNSILFFPILAGKEEQSWKDFIETAMPLFFAETYQGGYQEEQIEQLLLALPSETKVQVPTKSEICIKKDIEFATVTDYKGEIKRLGLDLYCPAHEENNNRTLLLFVHGGAFRYPVDKTQTYVVELCKCFASMGYVCASVDYRLREGKDMPTKAHEVPAMEDASSDVNQAVAFLRKNAHTLGFDPNRMFLLGGSAGGRTVVGYTFAKPERKFNKEGVCGVVVLWGCPEAEFSDSYALSNQLPIAIIHGDADKTIAIENARTMKEKLITIGCQPNTKTFHYEEVPNGEHTLANISDRLEAVVVPFVERFLKDNNPA